MVAVGDIYCRLLERLRVRTFDLRPEPSSGSASSAPSAPGSDFVSACLPDPLRRHPDRCRALGPGRGAAAERARRTCAQLPLMRDGPLRRLADLRLRQGRFEEARRLLEGSESHPSARRTRAAIAYAEGMFELAAELTPLCLGTNPKIIPVVHLSSASSSTPALRVRTRPPPPKRSPVSSGWPSGPTPRAASPTRRTQEVGSGPVDQDFEADPVPELQAALRAFGDLGLPLEARLARNTTSHGHCRRPRGRLRSQRRRRL